MPTYKYTNRETGETIAKTMSIAEMLKYAADGISIEGVYYERDIAAEHMRQATRGAATGWPLKSDAAGVHPDDAKKASESSAKMGVPTEFDKKTGQAIFRDRSHRRAYLKATGMHDRQGGYGDG